MKIFRHIALVLTALLIASCAIDEMWDGVHDAEGEEVVMTFKPKFEDFESVTKAIGDGTKVDNLLVQVYADGAESPEFSQEYNKGAWNNIKISFFYGKTYKVYFWAYAKSQDAYEIAEGGLKNGVTVNYPENTDDLGHDALEYLDAFYAVETINLSDDIADNTKPSLTRPFAQVNLVADKAELETAKATKVEFTIDAADSFVPGGDALSSQSRTFTFTDENFFKNNEEISEGKVYLGTTYLFVSSNGSLDAKVTLYDSMDNKLKGPSTVAIPLASNQRTNLVFTGVEPAWDDDAMDVPAESDGWIHIETPEQMAAFLLEGLAEGAKVHVCLDINMGGLPQKYHEAIAARTFTDLTLYGGALESGNPVGGGSHMISNFTAPAFLANAAGLTVSDLVLDNFKVEGNGHVGTLVNTLKGGSTFTNVTVSNSSATTSNGAAGGVVGYIVRNTPTSRSESVSVSFDNCDLSAVTATGSLTDGKFVGRLSGYDNGEVVTFTTTCSAEGGNSSSMSKYVSSNLACWLTDAERSAFNGWIGDEVYYRGKVSYGDTRVAVKWDGTTTVEPLLANATYDAGTTAGTNRFVVYSAFDLAGVQKKNASPAALYLMNHVDMFGYGEDGKYNVHSNFINSANASDDDNVFKPFNSIGYLEGNNNFIYNLCLSTVGTTSYNSAFIISGGANHTHQNIKFDNCCTVVPHVVITSNGQKEDKSYGATFIQSVDGGGYKMNNVHITNSRVFAIQKTGVLAGRVLSSGGATISNCSVDNCYVENYECKDNLEKFTDSSGKVSADFYSYGEIGGLIGFVMYKATITGCSVSNTTVHAYGQDDKAASLSGYSVPVYIQGRNVNEFIGDVRCMGNYTIEITNCSVSNNTCSERNDVYTKSRKDYPIIGKAYYVGASVSIIFATLKVGEDPGTLKVQNITNDGTKLFTSSTTVSLQSLVG